VKIIPIIFSLLFVSFSNAQVMSTIDKSENNMLRVDDEIPIYNFESLEPLLYTNTNKIFIVNFWAMWCAPCVKELPIFQEYKKDNPNIDILLISMDFPEDIETKLKPFLKKKGYTSKVILLDDPDSNSWIDKVYPNWSGAIPFTIIFDSKNRSFHERAFKDLQDLENEINKTIKNN
jgi:thiol-disulfide isomerase/thioredoxin